MTYVLTALAAVLYALGWVAGKVALAAGWCWSALAVGWDEARRPPLPRNEAQTAAVPSGR